MTLLPGNAVNERKVKENSMANFSGIIRTYDYVKEAIADTWREELFENCVIDTVFKEFTSRDIQKHTIGFCKTDMIISGVLVSANNIVGELEKYLVGIINTIDSNMESWINYKNNGKPLVSMATITFILFNLDKFGVEEIWNINFIRLTNQCCGCFKTRVRQEKKNEKTTNS